MMTDYHAKYFAHELTRRCASDSVEKLTAVLSDAQVELTPHQIEAALFAFRNPFSRGAILADEVGLGKTIEAGLLIAQKWAEQKRRLLVIVPANLRKQWSQELADKFFLPSAILENRTFNECVRAGNLNPFQQDAVVICSYQFARKAEPYIRQTPWDLVVIDEAHRLRNVYKPTNKIANTIKQSIAPFPKVLLTATPLQNSLLELYGLVSIVDEYAFGDLKTYRSRFTRLANDDDFNELKERLKPICKRTLRKQVLEYVSYTDRHALVQEFVPTPDEQKLYDLVTEYLQQPALHALPASQRSLMTLILRKLLASSTYAISGTLQGLAAKLDAAAKEAEAVDAPPEQLAEDWEEIDELADEWDSDDDDKAPGEKRRYTPEELAGNGVFGASDEVLGAVESGVDFEKRIAGIYQKCRTPQQIEFEFDQLQRDLDEEITAGQRDAREKLLDNFDQEVVEKVKVQSTGLLDRFNDRLWQLTRHLLASFARFDEREYSFYLTSNPFPGETIHPGPYRLGKNVEDANTYRVGHPLAQRVLAQATALNVPPADVTFDYSGGGKNIAVLAPLLGRSGWLLCSRASVQALETEESLILAAVTDAGEGLDDGQCRRLFDLPGVAGGPVAVPADVRSALADATSRRQSELLAALSTKNGQWFDTEMDKLDRWAEDRRTALRADLSELDESIKDTKKAARLAPNLPEKLEIQRKLRGLETKRDEAWRAYDTASRDVDRQKDTLLDEISHRLEQQASCEELFALRWRVA